MHNTLKYGISVLLVLCSTLQLNAATTQSVSAGSLLKKAASSYAKRDYTEAAQTYETILSTYGKSADLYYNLGNAYFKSDKIANAILNYERALRLSPGDDDARFNLQLCQTRIVDQITPVGKFIVVRWYESIGQWMGSNSWFITGLICFLLCCISLTAYFLARRRWLKKMGFFTGIFSLMLAALSIVYAWQAANKLEKSDEAIVFALSVTAKSSPDQSGNDLFVLHEGIKVQIKSRLSDWCEIELSDGNVGWIPFSDIEII